MIRRWISAVVMIGLSVGGVTACGENPVANSSGATSSNTSVPVSNAPSNSNSKQNNTDTRKPVRSNSSTSSATNTIVSKHNASSNALCRTNPMAGVYHPSRLQVIDPCKTVSGTVVMVRHEADKDYHINLKLDAKYAGLINSNNVKYEHSELVVEVIPMDSQHIPVPTVGEHISVTGSYVNDHAHGWMEIHPAWFINGKGTTAYTAAAAAASVQTGVCGNGDADCQDPMENPSATLPTTNSTKTNSTGTNTSSQSKAIEVVTSTLTVPRGSDASVTIQTKPKETGSIVVEYKSGPSKASGLGNKTAGTDGRITWSWKVGTRTTLGDWPVTITVGNSQVTLTLHVVQ